MMNYDSWFIIVWGYAAGAGSNNIITMNPMGNWPRVYVLYRPHPTGQYHKAGVGAAARWAAGQSGPSGIANTLNGRIAANVYYDPAVYLPGDPIGVVLELSADYQLTAKTCNCSNQASLMAGLLGYHGIPAGSLFLFGGSDSSTLVYDRATRTSLRCLVGSNDAAPALPRFVYHALCTAAGGVYDPSYGTIGEPYTDCFCPDSNFGARLQRNTTGSVVMVDGGTWECLPP